MGHEESRTDQIVIDKIGELANQRFVLNNMYRSCLEELKKRVMCVNPASSNTLVEDVAAAGAELMKIREIKDKVSAQYGDLVRAWAAMPRDLEEQRGEKR